MSTPAGENPTNSKKNSAAELTKGGNWLHAHPFDLVQCGGDALLLSVDHLQPVAKLQPQFVERGLQSSEMLWIAAPGVPQVSNSSKLGWKVVLAENFTECVHS
jgi:hypothetical protein